MFSIIKQFTEYRANRKLKYERPLLFANSDKKGFQELLDKYSANIRVAEESSIRFQEVYFYYLGNGKFIKKKRFDLHGDKASNLPVISDETEQRILEFANGVGEDSPVFDESDIFTLAFYARKEILGM